MVINKTEDKWVLQFIEKVLKKIAFKKDYELNKEVVIESWDWDRVELKTKNKGFSIRIWIDDDSETKMRINWTMYVDVPNENGGSSGEEIGCGLTVVTIEE